MLSEEPDVQLLFIIHEVSAYQLMFRHEVKEHLPQKDQGKVEDFTPVARKRIAY